MSRSLGSRGRPAWAVPVVPLLLVCLAGPAAGGQEEKEKSFTVAKSLSPAGTFAARAGEGEPWRVIGEGEDLRSGELLVGLPGASLRGVNGAVRLIFRSDFEGRSPVPAMETAVRLHPPEGRDLDLTLDRGRVELVNARKEGPARVRLRFEDQQWDLTLAGPGARAAVEMAGRLPPGSRFRPRAKEDPEPTVYLVVLAVKGEAVVDTAAHRFHLHAPPGPALLYWDSVSDRYVPPVRLAELPDWAEPDKDLGPEAKKSQAVAAEFRELIVEKGIPEAIAEFYRSPDPVRQRIALIAMGATDDLRQLGEALSAAKNPVVWDFGIQVVRNWLG
ncbi:MAG TPA: hypothetical protein VIL46_18075, partial [Gemmataceae bacterium]